MASVAFDTANREVAALVAESAGVASVGHEPLNADAAPAAAGTAAVSTRHLRITPAAVATPQIGAPLHQPGQHLSTLA
jgi:hypothetical protein